MRGRAGSAFSLALAVGTPHAVVMPSKGDTTGGRGRSGLTALHRTPWNKLCLVIFALVLLS